MPSNTDCALRYWEPSALSLFMMLFFPLPSSVPASSPTPPGMRPPISSASLWTRPPSALGTTRPLPLMPRHPQLALGPFETPSLRPRIGNPATIPPPGEQTPLVPTTLAKPTPETGPPPRPSGAGAHSLLGALPLSPPAPLPTLLPPANPPLTAATHEAGRTPAATTTPARIPAALDPGVAPAPPPPVEVDSPADLSRFGGRLSFFAPAWVAAPQSVRTIVSRGFHWTWLDRPPRLRPPTFTQSLPDLTLPVQDWVTKGVVYPVPHQPCFQSRIFTVPRPDGRPPPHHNRLVAPQSVYPRPTVPPRQSLHARPSPPASSSHGVVGHFRGLHTHPHPPQPSSIPGFLLQQPTLLLSGSPIRPQRGTLHIYQSPGLAPPYPPHPGDQCPRLPRRHCPLAPLPRRSPPARRSNGRETLGHGLSGQPPEVSAGTPDIPPVAGHPLACADRTLAGVPGHPGQNPAVYPPASSKRPHHPPALGGSGGPHQLRVPGAQPLEGLPPASDCGSVTRLSPGPRRFSSHSPVPPPGLTVLDGSPHLGLCSPIPSDSSPPVPLDRRLSLGMGCTSPPASHSSRPLGSSGGNRSHQRARASGSPPGHHDFQPVVLPPCRVYGQRDGSVRVDAPLYSLPPLTGGTQNPLTRHGQTTGVCSSPPHSHLPQCGGGRSEPARTAQHGVDVTSGGLPSGPSLGRSPSGRSPGLSNELSSSAVGLPIPSPGCSGLQLSQFRLERLRQHLRVSASRADSHTAPTHPRLQRPSCAGGSLGPPRSLVALSPPARSGPPPSADDPVPTLRTRPGLPQVGDLRTLDRISFLRRALLASRPAAVVDTLLASYRPSSQRQQEVAWTAFRRWLPLDRSTVTKDDVLAFLQHLFSTRSLPLVPSLITVQPYNGPWRRPSRWISPTPISPALPQAFFTSAPRFPLTSPSGTSQRLSIFTNRLTISPAPLVCYFLKPFFSQPWPLATGVRSWPISPAGPLSTRDRLLLYPFSLVFCLKIRLLPAVPLLFLFLPFPPIPLSALSRPCAYFSVAPPPGTTRISSL